jgi:hypothetical protein
LTSAVCMLALYCFFWDREIASLRSRWRRSRLLRRREEYPLVVVKRDPGVRTCVQGSISARVHVFFLSRKSPGLVVVSPRVGFPCSCASQACCFAMAHSACLPVVVVDEPLRYVSQGPKAGPLLTFTPDGCHVPLSLEGCRFSTFLIIESPAFIPITFPPARLELDAASAPTLHASSTCSHDHPMD